MENKPDKFGNTDYISEVDEEYDEEEEDYLDEETRAIIFNKINDIDYTMSNNKKEDIPKKSIKQKSSNVLSLIDFNKKLQSENKKFISKRVEAKRKVNNIEQKKVRQFNPRLPPYNHVHKSQKNNNLDINSNNDFPTL